MPTTPFECPADHRHGDTSTCYNNHHCRCETCITSHTEEQYWRRGMHAAGREDVFDSNVDALGVRRRLQALMAFGYSARRIGAQLGVTADQILQWAASTQVRRSTVRRVDAAYEHLSARPPATATTGDRISVSRARRQAKLRGYAPPLAWDDIDTDKAPTLTTTDAPGVDDVAIDLACDGFTVRLTAAERVIVVRTLAGRGLDDGDIAPRAGCHRDHVQRIRRLNNIPAAIGPDQQRTFAA